MGPTRSSKREDGGAPRTDTPVLVSLRDVAPQHPEPPAGLDERLVDEWRTLWRCGAARWLTKLDLPALERLFECRQDHARISGYLDSLSLEEMVITDGQGQRRMHPFCSYLLDLESQMLALESQLGLTPASRSELGIRVETSWRCD